MTRNLAELRAPDVARLVTDRSIFVQPLGAVEQHGPHLPFNTDLVIADRISQLAVARVGDDLDAPATWRTLASWCADGIMTSRPRALAAELRRSPPTANCPA